jgi:hypothetical protein
MTVHIIDQYVIIVLKVLKNLNLLGGNQVIKRKPLVIDAASKAMTASLMYIM